MNWSLLKSILVPKTATIFKSILPMQPVRTAYLYESKHRVNVMKRMSVHGIHNQLGRKSGHIRLWEKLIRGDEVIVGS